MKDKAGCIKWMRKTADEMEVFYFNNSEAAIETVEEVAQIRDWADELESAYPSLVVNACNDVLGGNEA